MEKFPTFYLLLSLLAVAILSNCSRLHYDITPDAEAMYRSMRLKFNVKNLHTGDRQHFKVLLKYNSKGDKMFFLSPLNQIYGILTIENERALLVNNRKKRYWLGNFSQLLQYMWGREMDFRYAQFKKLVTDGQIPQRVLKAKHIDVDIASSDDNSKPQSLTITNPDVLVKVKISGRKRSSGSLSLAIDIKDMTRSGIGELLE